MAVNGAVAEVAVVALKEVIPELEVAPEASQPQIPVLDMFLEVPHVRAVDHDRRTVHKVGAFH